MGTVEQQEPSGNSRTLGHEMEDRNVPLPSKVRQKVTSLGGGRGWSEWGSHPQPRETAEHRGKGSTLGNTGRSGASCSVSALARMAPTSKGSGQCPCCPEQTLVGSPHLCVVVFFFKLDTVLSLPLYRECCMCCGKEPVPHLEHHEEKCQIPFQASQGKSKIFGNRMEISAGLSEGGIARMNIQGDHRQGICSQFYSSSFSVCILSNPRDLQLPEKLRLSVLKTSHPSIPPSHCCMRFTEEWPEMGTDDVLDTNIFIRSIF